MIGDGAPSIVFEDRRYGGGPTRGFDIGPEDLEPIGTISDAPEGIEGTTAYALDGVDPSLVIIIRSHSAELGEYLILFSQGSIDGAEGYPSFPTIPGLCRYVTPAPSGCD
jgi:hypothetical protein